MRYPPITCLCPTYGRYEQLKDALAAFEAQGYTGEAKLIILNGSPRRLECASDKVHVMNRPEDSFATLGHKRQALLELADTELVAHWDDDDVYFPWHLTRSVRALQEHDAGCVRAKAAHYITGPKSNLDYRGIRHNVFEGSMVFNRQEAIDLGGYALKHSGQAKALLRHFKDAGRLYNIPECEGWISYAYRWADGVGHISGIGNSEEAKQRFKNNNTNHGASTVLTPGDLTPYYHIIPGNKTTTNPQ